MDPRDVILHDSVNVLAAAVGDAMAPARPFIDGVATTVTGIATRIVTFAVDAVGTVQATVGGGMLLAMVILAGGFIAVVLGSIAPPRHV